MDEYQNVQVRCSSSKINHLHCHSRTANSPPTSSRSASNDHSSCQNNNTSCPKLFSLSPYSKRRSVSTSFDAANALNQNDRQPKFGNSVHKSNPAAADHRPEEDGDVECCGHHDSTPKNRPYKKRSSQSSGNVGSPVKLENRLSKLFNLKRNKSKEASSETESVDESVSNSPAVTDAISADLCLAEKAEKMLEAHKMPVVRWRQAHVLSWLELELGMGQYSKIFAENVKSGRVLINLSNNDLEKTLRLTNPMHKKKLRLAIEEYRAPTLWKFPLIKEVTTNYMCSHFLPSIGLKMYADTFRANLVDGRVMNYLNKDQMAKYFNVTKRFHQTSILKGIELLRMVDYDIKALNKRRLECEKENADLLVWTNSRMAKWLKQIDLEEYLENVEHSGLHGAVAVLDASFNAETLATALKIPCNKRMIRKHLADEFDTLQHQARNRFVSSQSSTVKQYHHGTNRQMPKSLSSARNLVRSNTADGFENGALEAVLASRKKREGIRGSIVRALGIKTSNDYENVSSEFLFKFSGESASDGATARTDSARSTAQTSGVAEMSTPSSQLEQSGNVTNGSVGTGLDNHSSATMSSTTSDLGSSIERSQHLKTILGPTSQVLAQKPMTSVEQTPRRNLASLVFGSSSPLRRSGSSAAIIKSAMAAEQASSSSLIKKDFDSSSKLLLDNSPASSSGCQSSVVNVKLRRKKFPTKDEAKKRHFSSTKRPHSMGDFTRHTDGPINNFPGVVDRHKAHGGSSLVSYLMNRQIFSGGLFKSWMSVENLHNSAIHKSPTSDKCAANLQFPPANLNVSMPPTIASTAIKEKRTIDTINECGELETSVDSCRAQEIVCTSSRQQQNNNFPQFPKSTDRNNADTKTATVKETFSNGAFSESLLLRAGWRKRRTRSVIGLSNVLSSTGQPSNNNFQDGSHQNLTKTSQIPQAPNSIASNNKCNIGNNNCRPQSLLIPIDAKEAMCPSVRDQKTQIAVPESKDTLCLNGGISKRDALAVKRSSSLNPAHETDL